MVRVTTNGVLRNYKSDLMRSANNLNYARNMVLTQRNFNSYAEDPASATLAFQLRRSFWRNSDHLTNSQAVTNKFSAAFSAMNTVSDDLGNAANSSVLRGLNTPTGSGREPLGQQLVQLADEIVQSMNSKYGDTFIFAGADGLNVPFSWDETTGNLLYRGVNVNAGGVPKPDTPEPADPNDPNDPNLTDEWKAYYADQEDLKKLETMANEATYVDLGLGMKEDINGNLITSSAYNSALSGLNALGYGVDEDGDPKNVASIVKELGEILSRCRKDAADGESADQDGAWASEQDQIDANRLQLKLKDALSNLTSKKTELSTKVSFLNDNTERLEDNADMLNEQILSIEQVDLADAITSFSWAQYCYNAALKVGNSILSQSLIDYMS